MRLNIGDYLADTVHLNATQHGAYLLLLFATFKRGFLPDDERVLARITRMSTRAWKRERGPVLALFQRVEGGFRHKRIDAERAEAERLASRARASRDRGGARESTDFLAGAPVTTATATKEGEGERSPSTPKEPSKPPTGVGGLIISLASKKKGNGHDGA